MALRTTDRWARRAGAITLTTVALLVVCARPASAHITVHADNATAGAADVQVQFRTPNERGNATTTKLQVFLPQASPLVGVLVAPMQGWRSLVRVTKLAKPVHTDDGPVTEVASEITWSGGHIPVGGYLDFAITVGQLPDKAGDLVFKALQTYTDGTVVRWIETAAPGAPEPDHPAPVLHLAASTSTTDPTSAASPGAVVTVANSVDTSDGLGRALAIAALAVAVVALLTSLALLRRRRA
jgi:uncharacterized protein YcnI